MNNNNRAGIGFIGLLTVAFIVIKLSYAPAWSWWWVLSPIWITALFIIVVFLIVLTVMIVRDK